MATRRKVTKKSAARKTSKKTTSRRVTGAKPPSGAAPSRKKAAGKKPARKQAARKKTTRKKRTSAASTPREPARPGEVRLNKLLADHGVSSRRAADELIAAGHVFIDGEPATELGTRVDPGEHVVEVQGVRLTPGRSDRKRYYLLNKPPGVVCTNEPREVRPRAIDLITDKAKGRIYTVGRLDEESKGLILLTNDGEFANRVMHPRYGVTKTYLVKLRGRITDEELNKLRGGVHLSEGRTAGARIVVRKRTREYTHLIVTLREGLNREIRRMFARVGAKVADLRRARIGNLDDRGLKLGSWRPLSPVEVKRLFDPVEEDDDADADSAAGGGRRGSERRAAARKPQRKKGAATRKKRPRAAVRRPR